MKNYQKLTAMAVLIWTTTQTSTMVLAQSAASEPAPASAPQPAAEVTPPATNNHLKLCEMLGLKEGRTYEFIISNNEDVHYWTIRSLGARGWILVKDSRYPATWLNLSQVIAVTPIGLNPAAERAKKPNRAR